MKETEFKKKPYVAPVCTVIPMQTENFICTSVLPDAPASVEEGFEYGGEVEGGELDF